MLSVPVRRAVVVATGSHGLWGDAGAGGAGASGGGGSCDACGVVDVSPSRHCALCEAKAVLGVLAPVVPQPLLGQEATPVSPVSLRVALAAARLRCEPS